MATHWIAPAKSEPQPRTVRPLAPVSDTATFTDRVRRIQNRIAANRCVSVAERRLNEKESIE